MCQWFALKGRFAPNSTFQVRRQKHSFISWQPRKKRSRELGYALDWEELPAGQDSRISISLNDADLENETDWPRQHEWLARRLNEMHRVLAPRVRALDPALWRPES
jgi:hypothetical protein